MKDLQFYNPTKLYLEKDAEKQLDLLVPKGANVLVVYDKIAESIGVLDEVKAQLEKNDRKLFFFDEIKPNPQFSDLMKAVEIGRKENVNYIIAVGGGSIMDGAKFISMVMHNEFYKGKEDKYLLLDGDMTGVVEGVPLGCVPTTPATASQMNPHAVISNGHDKLGISNWLQFPTFAIMKPEYTLTIPKKVLGSGIADAMSHALEQYITYPVNGRVQDQFTEGLLRTLIDTAPIVMKDSTDDFDWDERANWMLASTFTMNTMIGAGMPQDFAAHMIGHELTAQFGIPHGSSLSLVTTRIWRVRKESKLEKLVQYAEKVWGITQGTPEDKADAAIEKTEEFFNKVLLQPLYLEDWNVSRTQIDVVIDSLEKHGYTALTERGDMGLDQSREVLELAFKK